MAIKQCQTRIRGLTIQKTSKPIKRNKNLQSLRRDHHQSLLLCWKIRTGFSKGVLVQRIKRYTEWFFGNPIYPHFEMEEKYLFPILGNPNELVGKAISKKFVRTKKIPFLKAGGVNENGRLACRIPVHAELDKLVFGIMETF